MTSCGARPETAGSEVWRRAADGRAAVLVYNFEAADVAIAWNHFELCEAECKKLIDHYAALSKDKSEGDGIAREKSRFPLLGAYDLCLKCSHYFNILDARGAISVTERVGVIARVRALASVLRRLGWISSIRPIEATTRGQRPESRKEKGKLLPAR